MLRWLYFRESVAYILSHNSTFPRDLRLPGTYAAKIDKIRTPLHVSINNSVTRPLRFFGGDPPKNGQLQNSTINCPPLQNFMSFRVARKHSYLNVRNFWLRLYVPGNLKKYSLNTFCFRQTRISALSLGQKSLLLCVFCPPPHKVRNGGYWIRHRLSVRPSAWVYPGHIMSAR